MWGLSEVQAGGRMLSSVDAKPCTMLYPVTEAVIEPIVAAAKATVEIWPMDMTEARIKENSAS